jgi:hypothetical protein
MWLLLDQFLQTGLVLVKTALAFTGSHVKGGFGDDVSYF